MSVEGGFSTGTTGSGSFDGEGMERWDKSGGGGGGSANSAQHVGNNVKLGLLACSPSDTGLNSTKRHPLPCSGISIQMCSSPSSAWRTSVAYVHAFSPISLCPVFKSKSYLTSFVNQEMLWSPARLT